MPAADVSNGTQRGLPPADLTGSRLGACHPVTARPPTPPTCAPLQACGQVVEVAGWAAVPHHILGLPGLGQLRGRKGGAEGQRI